MALTSPRGPTCRLGKQQRACLGGGGQQNGPELGGPTDKGQGRPLWACRGPADGTVGGCRCRGLPGRCWPWVCIPTHWVIVLACDVALVGKRVQGVEKTGAYHSVAGTLGQSFPSPHVKLGLP